MDEIRQQIENLNKEKIQQLKKNEELEKEYLRADLGNSRMELALKVITQLEKRYIAKVERYENYFERLKGDILMLAFDLVYLGALDNKTKSEIIASVVEDIAG
mmetsp:Transcript_40787/g.36207  ORF Transcript_40787/g.36207 Transcript_40787/m.36207 type:complete len:103 (+) Transcript_40787:215-523(+)